MPIVGLTVGEDGAMIQRLAVVTKVAIGQVVKTATGTRPDKLDHFTFLRKGSSLEWEPDQELIEHFGKDCREFVIVLLDDDIDNVFRTQLAWWSKTERKCWGDGRAAIRRTEQHPEGEPWEPCGDTCPDLQAKKCKPSGDLYFILADRPRLGSVCRLHTTSYRSVVQMHSALEQIRTVTGGRLAGIRCKLVVRPEKAAYLDAKDGKKKSTTIYALNIEIESGDMRKMLGRMTQYAQLFAQTQKLLGSGRKVEYQEENENDRAIDVTAEFYPEGESETEPAEVKPQDPKTQVRQPSRKSEQPPPPPPESEDPGWRPATKPKPPDAPAATAGKPRAGGGPVISHVQRATFYNICLDANWNTKAVTDALQKRFGLESSTKIPVSRYDEICAFFKNGGDPPTSLFKAGDEDLPEQMR